MPALLQNRLLMDGRYWSQFGTAYHIKRQHKHNRGLIFWNFLQNYHSPTNEDIVNKFRADVFGGNTPTNYYYSKLFSGDRSGWAYRSTFNNINLFRVPNVTVLAEVKLGAAALVGMCAGTYYTGVHDGFLLGVTGAGKIRFEVCTAVGSTFLDGNSLIRDGNWHTIAGFNDGTNAHVYLDGFPDIAPAACPNIANTGDRPFQIGWYYNDNLAKDLNGEMRNIQVWNRPLSDKEIYDIYQNPLGTPLDPRVDVVQVFDIWQHIAMLNSQQFLM